VHTGKKFSPLFFVTLTLFFFVKSNNFTNLLHVCDQECTNPGNLLAGHQCFIWQHLIFSAQSLPFIFLTNKNVYQFECTKQKAQNNTEHHRSLQNCQSSVWNLFHITLLVLRIWWQLLYCMKPCTKWLKLYLNQFESMSGSMLASEDITTMLQLSWPSK
jgi:hypothetical protein